MTRKFALLLALFALAGPAVAEPAFVAKVNGVAIPTSEFSRALKQALATGQTDTPQLRRLVVQRLIVDELFWQEARKRKLDKSAESDAAAEHARRESAIRQYVLAATKPAEPSDAEVRQRYDQTVANLGPREYRLSLIQTPDEQALRDAAKRIADGADFAAQARQVSKAPSAARGGELDWLSFPLPPVEGHTNGLPLEVAQAVAKLAPGQISAPIHLRDTWAVVRLDAQRPTLVPPFEQVETTMRRAARVKAAEEAGRALAQSVMRGARIEVPGQAKPVKESRP
jgi:peptidyl-prolyl cis-trans isomerase C